MICDHVWQVFSEDGRDFVFQVTRKHLTALSVSGIELIFSPGEHRKIRNEGTKFQEFAQQAVMLQRQSAGDRSANERLLEVFRLAEEAMDIVARIAQTRDPEVDATADSLTQAIESHPREGIVAAGVDLATALRRRISLPDKWNFLLGLVPDIHNPALVSLVDQALSELLKLKPGIDALLAAPLSQSALVRVFLTLSGDSQHVADAPGDVDLQRWTTAMRWKPLPWVMGAGRLRLAEVLAMPKPLTGQDPRHEWRALSRLKGRCLALPKLPRDPNWIELCGRRANLLATPERLKVILDEELWFSSKILVCLRLLGEVEDAKIKGTLMHVVGQLIEHNDCRRQFAGSNPDDFAKAAQAVRNAIADHTELPPFRRDKFLEALNVALTPPQQGRDKRQSDRFAAGPEDRIDVGGIKLKLRNWSPKGLLFDAGNLGFYVGQRADGTVLIRNIRLVINFEVTIEVVRVADNAVAAQYKFKDKTAEQKVSQFFG